jgi:NAD(P)-dependent dehydrogenase (short-subunit alcohol dehydrogenase family)
MENKIAIVTGGRIKIGFETALILLRSNCTVIVTSRFANDAIKR